MKLIVLELNELNLDYLIAYAKDGRCECFANLIDKYGIAETRSEEKYENLEPWIQWVTAHTGLEFDEHNIFRLGDIEGQHYEQIWEYLERNGFHIGAVSPMNARNQLRDPAFFVPDPWTPTNPSGSRLLRNLYRAVSQAVNDNAKGKMARSSLFWLIAGGIRYARPLNYFRYIRFALAATRKPWKRALFLDLLLADVFVRESRRENPDFASLFLNAGAHIQHHYMFNSLAYSGEKRNPDWYVAPGDDPVGEVYECYDQVVRQVLDALPGYRIMIATGLHQNPHDEVTYYWRLKDHESFLKRIGLSFLSVAPRMSRDFIVQCSSVDEAAAAETKLNRIVSLDNSRLFETDNRGMDLFVTLVWSRDIEPDFVYLVDGVNYSGLREDVSFVAIKNGQHDGVGYFLDTGALATSSRYSFLLSDLPSRICEALGIQWQPRGASVSDSSRSTSQA